MKNLAVKNLTVKKNIKLKTVFVFLVTAGIFGGCNFFEFIDSPSGDAQLISAARACFDRGDFECALEYYGQLSSDSDVRSSEEAFVILERQGVGMGAFMTAIGEGRGGGEIVTRLADHIAASGTSETKRIAIHDAFLRVSSIGDANLRGLVRFASATGLLAHLLAEHAGGDATLQKTDLVPSATACLNGGIAACAANCSGEIPAASRVDLSQSSSVLGAVTLGMVDAAINEITTSLSGAELGGSGKFSTKIEEFAQALANGDPNALPDCYHFLLISNKVGG